MAGYAHDFSKSNNALAAEDNGAYPLTHAARIVAKQHGISQQHAKQWLLNIGPCEWHHTSKFYNLTDYYNTDLQPDDVADLLAFKPVKTSTKPTTVAVDLGLQVIKYNEWTGSLAHRRCVTVIEYAHVIRKGDRYYFNGRYKSTATVLSCKAPWGDHSTLTPGYFKKHRHIKKQADKAAALRAAKQTTTIAPPVAPPGNLAGLPLATDTPWPGAWYQLPDGNAYRQLHDGYYIATKTNGNWRKQFYPGASLK